MIIDTTEVQDINSFSILESLKEVYGIIWILVPILTLILGITIGVLVIVWLEREISAGIQQRIGPEYTGPLGVLQALADETKLIFKENLIPSRGDIRLFSIGPYISVISILVSYSVIRTKNGFHFYHYYDIPYSNPIRLDTRKINELGICFYLLLSKNNQVINDWTKPRNNSSVRNYRGSPLRSNNSIELSMIVCVIASTIPGISMNPIIEVAQDTLF